MRISKEQKAQVEEIRTRVNGPKHELIQILNTLEYMGGQSSRAKALGRIIGKLEAWQHK